MRLGQAALYMQAFVQVTTAKEVESPRQMSGVLDAHAAAGSSVQIEGAFWILLIKGLFEQRSLPVQKELPIRLQPASIIGQGKKLCTSNPKSRAAFRS